MEFELKDNTASSFLKKRAPAREVFYVKFNANTKRILAINSSYPSSIQFDESVIVSGKSVIFKEVFLNKLSLKDLELKTIQDTTGLEIAKKQKTYSIEEKFTQVDFYYNNRTDESDIDINFGFSDNVITIRKLSKNISTLASDIVLYIFNKNNPLELYDTIRFSKDAIEQDQIAIQTDYLSTLDKNDVAICTTYNNYIFSISYYETN